MLFGRQKAFTLIEMILVIVIVGILASVLFTVLRGPIQASFDVRTRANLVGIAETALQRMAREVRLALPNSVRLSGGTALEFLRTVDGGRYRDKPPGDKFQPNKNSDSFDVLGSLPNSASIDTGSGSSDCLGGVADCLVIYNTGQPSTQAEATATGQSANAYLGMSTNYDGNIATVSAVSSNSLSYDNSDVAGWKFAFESPRQRFQVVDTPVSYICNGNEITRYDGYTIQPSQPVPPGVAGNLLIDKVSACNFSYDPGSATRAGLLTFSITVSDDGQDITLFQQVHVENVP